MRIQLTKPQSEFTHSPYANPAFIGGYGAGKSQAATLRLCHLLSQQYGVDVSHFFPSYRLAKRRGLSGTTKHLKALGWEYVINKQDLTISIPSRESKIYLETYSDPEAIVSFEVAHSVVDELDTLEKDRAELVWTKISERTRQNCGGINTVACVTTPDQGESGFCFEKWRYGENKEEGYHYIRAGTESNKFLPKGYVEQIAKNYDPVMAEAFIFGGWVNFTKNKVYHYFSRTKHHTDRIITPQDHYLHIGQDFNIGGCCSTVFVIDSGYPIAVDEFVSHDTRDLCIQISSRYPTKHISIYPDASGDSRHTNASESDLDILRAAGFSVFVNGANPAIRDRINAFNGLLAHDKLKINTNTCSHLAHALDNQGYDKKGQPEKLDVHPSIDDRVDNAGYFLAFRYPVAGLGGVARMVGY
jgi:hypothetical protein